MISGRRVTVIVQVVNILAKKKTHTLDCMNADVLTIAS